MASAEVSELVEAAPRRGPVLPDVDDVRDGLAADRGRPPVPGPQRGLEGRAGPADGAPSPSTRKAAGAGTIVLRDLLLRRPRAGRGGPRARLRQDVAAGLARLRAGRRAATRSGSSTLSLEGARAPAQGRAAVRRRLRRRVPDVRGPRGQRRRARPPVRALPRRAGARARPELVPAAAHVPARHARAPVVGADDAAAEGDRRGRRLRRALRSARATTRR